MTGCQSGTPSPPRTIVPRMEVAPAPSANQGGVAREDDSRAKSTPSQGPEPTSENVATSGPLWSSSSLPWLVVSLCDGIGSIFICLTMLGLPFGGIAAEIDSDLRDFAHRKFPRLTLFSDCTSVTLNVVLKQFRSRQYGGIFLVGGPPCQPFSTAGRKRGFDDVRAAPMRLLLHAQAPAARSIHTVPFRLPVHP